jgi:hypothetical protein
LSELCQKLDQSYAKRFTWSNDWLAKLVAVTLAKLSKLNSKSSGIVISGDGKTLTSRSLKAIQSTKIEKKVSGPASKII